MHHYAVESVVVVNLPQGRDGSDGGDFELPQEEVHGEPGMHGGCYGDDALEEKHGACGGALYDAAEIGDYDLPSLADAADGENSAAVD